MQEFNFLGLLANVDSSILHVDLQNGFEITAVPVEEATDLISILVNSPRVLVRRRLFMDFHCIEGFQRKVYAVTNSFEATRDEQGISLQADEFEGNLINGYLSPVLRLMRLFKPGNIFMPCYYLHYVKNGKPQLYMSAETTRQTTVERYRLDETELPDLQKFIQDTKLPFAMPFLELAFENFELSYEIDNTNLSFLTLVISLETLLNRGPYELRYSLSRNAAALLGRDKEQFIMIFNEVKNLYDKRSEIVHSGKTGVIAPEDLLRIRYYVRKSVKEVCRIGKDKDDLLALLNLRGFG